MSLSLLKYIRAAYSNLNPDGEWVPPDRKLFRPRLGACVRQVKARERGAP